jgi:hypothetical protein
MESPVQTDRSKGGINFSFGIKNLDKILILPIIYLDLLPVRHAARPRAGLFFLGREYVTY